MNKFIFRNDRFDSIKVFALIQIKTWT